MSLVRGVFVAFVTALRQLFRRRMTLRYPEEKLEIEGEGFQYDAKKAIGIPGYKGRHILFLDKCTGCQLCSIACENIADCIEMVTVEKKDFPAWVVPKQLAAAATFPQNKKSLWPQIDFGSCVFCGFCVHPDTFVITNPGIKMINEIQLGDSVLTHSGEFRHVTKVWDLRYTGPLYSIKVMGKPEPLVCTKDHPILAVRRERSNRRDGRLQRSIEPLEFVLPVQLKEGDYLVTPIIKKVVELSEYKQTVGLYRGESVKKELVLPCEKDLFRLIGYYLAEGFCYGGRTVRFSFNGSERDFIDDTKALLEKFFGKKSKERKNSGKGINVVFDSAIAESFFSEFGNGAQRKSLPDWVLFAPPHKQAELIKGIWRGDGSLLTQERQDIFNITTTSKTLAVQLQLVLGRLGIVAAIHSQRRRKKKEVFRVNIFGKYTQKMAEVCGCDYRYNRSKHADKFIMTQDYVYSPITSIDIADVHDQRVMDVTVETDHTFVPAGVVTSNCVDACPFDALYMTNEYELTSYTKEGLIFTPTQLAIPPKEVGKTVKFQVEEMEAYHG